MKSALFTILCWPLLASALAAQESIKEHKCKGYQQAPERVIVEYTEVKELKLLKQCSVEHSKECDTKGGLMSGLLYELLIDEKGNVECAELVKDAKDSPACLLAEVKNAILQFKFSAPQDKNGRTVACYHLLKMSINPVR